MKTLFLFMVDLQSNISEERIANLRQSKNVRLIEKHLK